jgi:hypothetical protein
MVASSKNPETPDYLSAFECYGCISAKPSISSEFRGIWCNRVKRHMAYDSPDTLADFGRCSKYSTGEVIWDIRAIP